MTASGIAPGTESLRDTIAAARGVLEPALGTALARLPGRLRHYAEYHYGFVDELGHRRRGSSSRLRLPTLVLLCARVDGGQWDHAVPAAVAWSLMGNHTLVHDDIVDEDTHRRGRPTLWAAFGVPAALHTGNALFGLAVELLAEQTFPAVLESSRRMGSAMQHMCAGQVGDMELESRAEVSLSEALDVVEAKAARIVHFACALGALCAGVAAGRVGSMAMFGHHIGMAAQLQDDLEDLWPRREIVGEPVRSDLIRRKKTPMAAAALRATGRDGARLAEFYRSTAPPAPAEVDLAAELIERCGGRAWAEQALVDHITLAEEHLSQASVDPPVHQLLTGFLTTFVWTGPRCAAQRSEGATTR